MRVKALRSFITPRGYFEKGSTFTLPDFGRTWIKDGLVEVVEEAEVERPKRRTRKSKKDAGA